MLASRIIYSFGLALSPQHLEQEKRATFFCIQSLIHKKKERKEEKMRKRKKRFGNNKKTELRNSEKNCHLPRLSIITTTNMCIWIFFLYARWFSYAFALNSLLLGDGEKKAAAQEEA